MNQYLSLSEKLANFTSISGYPGLYGCRVADYMYKEKRLLDALFLTVWNSRKIRSRVKDEATVDARGCNTSSVSLMDLKHSEILRLITSVRVSPLPSYSTRQCEKPQAVGRQRESDPTLFCVIAHNRGINERTRDY